MAVGSRALRRVQISNVEGTVGTAEAATEILFFEEVTQLTQAAVFHKPKQDRGSLARYVERDFQVSQYAELEMSGDLYDRLMVFIAANSIRGNVTATQPNAGTKPNEYLHVFEPALAALNTPDLTDGIDTFTLEWGNQIQEYESPYMVTIEWTIEGVASNDEDAAVTVSWKVFVRGVTESTFTAALSAPTTHQYFAVNKAKWFVDTSYAGIGGTQKTGVLKGFKYTFATEMTPRFSADGNFYFSGVNQDAIAPELELTMWRDNTVFEAELDKYLANPKTIAFHRIALFGHTEMDSGQANPPYIYLDIAGTYEDWPELDDEDGSELITVKLVGIQDPTSSKMMTVSVGTRMQTYA